MRFVFLVLFSSCAATLPEHTLREYERVLLATAGAYYAACVQLPPRLEVAAKCIVAETHLTAATELYVDLRGK